MKFLTELRDRWIWTRTVLSVYGTFQKFNEELRREKQESYQAGYHDGRKALLRELEYPGARIGKAAKN